MFDNGNLFELGIMARATWNLHSLNNEGTVGNVSEPRTVMLANGDKTDGISGEMIKHIHSYYVWMLESDKARFCQACQKMHPQKADENLSVTGVQTDGSIPAQEKAKEAMKRAMVSCTLCDLHGFLVQRPTISRSSTLEFGWVIGIPGNFHRDIHMHARHWMGGREVPEAGEEAVTEEVPERAAREVAAQMIYHRPTRSGIYAVISVFQPWRIGLNEMDYHYVIGENERKHRCELALEAYKATFAHPEGAMDTTRLPHIENFEGAIIISKTNFPAPVLSPLQDDYVEKARNLAGKMRLEIVPFADIEQFCDAIDELRELQPWALQMPTT
ncbi:MAG: DevR family CRISPR-associated autoregulator [Armatimonadota bacterium]|nr:DevR family CRISPR-associated autoregulator [Armatimonadota bacterium]